VFSLINVPAVGPLAGYRGRFMEGRGGEETRMRFTGMCTAMLFLALGYGTESLGDPFGPQPYKPPDSVDLLAGKDLDNLRVLKPGQAKLKRLPRFYQWRADRQLTHKQKSRIEKLKALALDGRTPLSWRRPAIRELGLWGHADAIPTLTKVLQTTDPKFGLRDNAAVALSTIADKSVIDPLIGSISDINVATLADEQLHKITHAKWSEWENPDEWANPTDPRPSYSKRDEYKAWLLRRQDRWRRWWKEHGTKIKLDRGAAFKHVGPY